jgi:hypothetical protein
MAATVSRVTATHVAGRSPLRPGFRLRSEDSGMPNSSASACAVCFLGQDLPDIQIDDDRGDPRPVLHRASAPSGAAPLVWCPQPHSRSISRCSVTLIFTGGRSKTWRRSTPGDRPARQARPAPAEAAQLVTLFPVRPGHLRQCPALVAILPAWLAAALSSAATGAPACQTPHLTVAWRSSAGSGSAAPQAQRSVPVPGPALPRGCASAASASASSPRTDTTRAARMSYGGGP